MISRIFYVLFAAFILSATGSFTGCAKNQKNSRPNILFIMADDLGYGELGCYGQQIIQTPHIDEPCQSGMRFTQFYTGAPVCAPSRCVLLTGKHTGHSFVRNNDEMKESN